MLYFWYIAIMGLERLLGFGVFGIGEWSGFVKFGRFLGFIETGNQIRICIKQIS